MDIFKEIITSLVPELKLMGFSKKGNNFYLKKDKNYGIVSFQKSRESSKSTCKFTINFGIYSDILGQLDYDYDILAKPEVEQCQWYARVGSFMPNTPDYWWTVEVLDGLSDIVEDVKETVQNIVLPEVKKRLSDEDLIESWLNDTYIGNTELGRFKYLTVLLKEKEDFSSLDQVVEKFLEQSKGKPNNTLAKDHLKEIGYDKV